MGRLLRGKIKDTEVSAKSDTCRSTSNARKTRTTIESKIDESKQTNKSSKVISKKRSLENDDSENVENNDSSINKLSKTIIEENMLANGCTLLKACISTDSNFSNPVVSITEKIDDLSSIKTSRSKKQIKNKNVNSKTKAALLNTDNDYTTRENKNTTINNGCSDGLYKETHIRRVLLDKTNSILKNNIVEESDKIKSKVHFSSVNNVRRITKRRISDYFNTEEHHHRIKELPELKSPNKKTDLNRISNLNESLQKLDAFVKQKIDEKNSDCRTDLSKTVVQDHHIPVYNQPYLNGRKSFRLTPPQVKNKDALYEFEVDENEEPKVKKKKKRRPVKTCRKKKRFCVDSNVGKPSGIDNVPQRTMLLRTNRQVSEHDNRVANICNEYDIIEIDAPDSEIPKNCNQTSENNINDVCITSIGNVSSNKSRAMNKSLHQQNTPAVNMNSKSMSKKGCGHNTGKNQIVTKASVHSDGSTVIGTIQNNSMPGMAIISPDEPTTDVRCPPVVSQLSIHSDLSLLKKNGNEHCVDSVLDIQDQTPGNSICISHSDKPSENVSNCTYGSHSPLPEYSRLHEGIHVGPVYNSGSINCSESEFNNNFMRGVTASTPFKPLCSPVRKHQFNVRLSGGETSNYRRVIESDSESEEEFFGFKVHDDSINVNLGKTQHKEVLPITNEPIQKVSVQEVIGILKNNVEKEKKPNKKVTNPSKVLFKNSSLLSPTNDNNYESCVGSSDSCYSQDSLQNITRDEGKKRSEDVIEEPHRSFFKPPRRSYSITPRRRNIPNYKEGIYAMDEHSEGEIEAPKKPPKKVHKPSKKQEAEINKLAAKINSQFLEIDKFKLVVE